MRMIHELPLFSRTLMHLSKSNMIQNLRTNFLFCPSCTSARNSSTILFCSKTGSQLLTNTNSLPATLQICKMSYKKDKWKNKNPEYESDQDSDDEDFVQKEKKKTDAPVIQVQSDNLRVDGIIKRAFGISRNKSEVLFYENKIRINGVRPAKKSASVNIGDEVDVIKGISEEHKNFIVVLRAEILKIRPSGDYLVITLRKEKNMTIENYEKDPWMERAPEESNEENNSELA